VLNPDVLVAKDCLTEALLFLIAHPEVGLLTPAVVDGEGSRQYPCKRYPTVLDLFLRGFAPSFLRRLFQKRLDHYEMRDVIGDEVVWDVPIVSGCFMLFRHWVLKQLGGFSSAYFLYFEDFDISLRTARVARIAYVPKVRITHFGGRAADKGWRHISLFLSSLVTFYKQHGWRWV
jgi:GT2 family glycosyltransferase